MKSYICHNIGFVLKQYGDLMVSLWTSESWTVFKFGKIVVFETIPCHVEGLVIYIY